MIDARRHHEPRAFTLTELLVAIAAVGLVTLGVGQIFSSVNRLTTLGRANAEVDAAARAIEQRLREDFDNFARMPVGETFLAIRMRELGDVNRNDNGTDAAERPIYLNADDLQADRREVLDPYEPSGGAGLPASRAVTRRLDEIMFIALAPQGRPYVSQQVVPGATESAPSAAYARIYWGHALRPQLDPDFDPDDPSQVPLRQYTPDGDFGLPEPLNPSNTYTPSDPETQPFIPRGRNRYASEWILARQPLLLFGGLAAGYPDIGTPSPPYPIDAAREFAPYISDQETMRRYADWGGATMVRQNPPGSWPIFWDTRYPDPRLIQWGRTDICAQDAADVRRWLEGEAPDYDPAVPPNQAPDPAPAGAFGSGYDSVNQWLVIDNPTMDEVNAPLWKRASMGGNGFATPEAVVEENLAQLRSAIASCFVRLLADDQVQRTQRTLGNTDRIQPEDATMDLHAIISSRCSNFEIAWSDGRRAVRPIDYDGDNTNEILPGDLLWFDIRPAIVQGGGVTRRHTFREWQEFEVMDQNGDPQTDRSFAYTDLHPRTEVPGEAFTITSDHAGNAWGVLLFHAQTNSPVGAASGEYSTAATGGDREPNDPSSSAIDPNELLAIWGFRLPTGDGNYGAPWPKPEFIRVRMTLHDAQNRLPNGKSYEFVFSLRSGALDRF